MDPKHDLDAIRQQLLAEAERKARAAREKREAAERDEAEARELQARLDRIAEAEKRIKEATRLLEQELAGIPPTESFKLIPVAEIPADVPSRQAPPSAVPKPETAPSIKEAVTRVIRNPKPEGWSAGEVAAILAAEGLDKHVAPRTFYSMIYMALKRGAKAGRFHAVDGDRGKLFSINHARSN